MFETAEWADSNDISDTPSDDATAPALSVLTNGEPAMALSDRLNETPRRRTGTPCSVGVLEDQLQGDEAAALDAMLHQLGWSAAKIYRAVVDEGHWISEQQINRHRSKSCGCFRDAA